VKQLAKKAPNPAPEKYFVKIIPRINKKRFLGNMELLVFRRKNYGIYNGILKNSKK
jgi:hypothetical protein